MKTPPLAARVFLKDLTRYWPLALAVAVMIVLNTLGPLWDLKVIIGREAYRDAINAFGVWPLIFILVVAVMQEDLTVGDRSFWRTRPIGPRPLLAGKLLFIAAVLVLPALVANLWLAAELDTPWRVALGIGIETTGLLLLMALLIALIGAITRSLMHASMAALGVLVAIFVIAAVPGVRESANSNQHAFTLPWDTDIRYPGSRIAMAGLFLSLVAIGALAHQFLTRRTRRTVWLALVGVPVAILTAGQWRFNFIAPPPVLVLEFPNKPLTGTEGVTITMEPPVRIFGTNWVFTRRGQADRKESIVSMFVNLHGLTEGRLFELGSAATKFRFPDGQEFQFTPVFTSSYIWANRQQEAAICRALGLEFAPVGEAGREIGIFSLSDAQLELLAGKRGRLTATYTLGERSFVEEVRLPARRGANWTHDGLRWRIDRASVNDETAIIQLRRIKATSMLAPYADAQHNFGENFSPGVGGNFGFVFLNRKRGEYVIRPANGRVTDGLIAIDAYQLNFNTLTLRRAGAPATGSSINAAWLADAELVVYRLGGVGRAEKTVVLDDFEMPKPERDALSPSLMQ